MTFLRAYGPVLVSTGWLTLLVVGLPLITATAVMVPPFALALQAYMRELQERMHFGSPRHRRRS